MGYVFALTEEDGGGGRHRRLLGLRLVSVSANVTSTDWWRHERSAEDLRTGDFSTAFHERWVEGVRALVRRQKATRDTGAHDHDRETLVSADFCPFQESQRDGLTCSIAPSSKAACTCWRWSENTGPRSACEESFPPGLIEVAQVLRCVTPGATPEGLTVAVCAARSRGALPGMTGSWCTASLGQDRGGGDPRDRSGGVRARLVLPEPSIPGRRHAGRGAQGGSGESDALHRGHVHGGHPPEASP